MRRELALVLGARVTWLVLALCAAVVGHSFGLAVDLFGHASASVAAGSMAAREFEPLLAVLRPTVGGWSFCVALIGPVVAARVLAIEKDRRTFQARLIAVGAVWRVVAAKAFAAWLGLLLLAAPILVCAIAWLTVGGDLGPGETAVAALGVALHAAWIAGVSIAAAAWSPGVSQATALALLASVSPWVVDAAGEFAALSWLQPAERLSITPHLVGFERGVLEPGAALWMLLAIGGALVLACVGARADVSRARLAAATIVVVVATLAALHLADRWRGGWDLSEAGHSSLPPPVAAAIAELPPPIVLDVALDRDDARRGQLERDVILRLHLARPDLVVRFPLDAASGPTASRDDRYGRILVQVGDRAIETWSASRRELVTLLFEAAGRPMPAWEYPPYPGHPHVVAPAARTWLGVALTLVLPLGFVVIGLSRPTERGR